MATFTTDQRKALADKGQAMPQGAYPIRNRADLQRAIQSFGRAKNPAQVKAWIIKRAHDLNAVDMLPEAWTTVQHQEEVNEFLAHFGVLGMHWGRHLPGRTEESHNPRPKKEPGPEGTQKSRNAEFDKNPTVRQYLTGTGDTFEKRAASRRNVGKAALVSILAGTAAKVAVSTIPQLAPYRQGVREVGTVLQAAGVGTALYAEVAGRADYLTSKK